MENEQHRDKNQQKANESPGNDKGGKEQRKAEDQGGRDENSQANKNFDLAQRRKQASPRSYNENTDSENIENQNTQAHQEQIDTQEENDKKSGFQGYGGEKLGDKASERQQTIDEDDAPKDRKKE